jgi:hypothetical protein
MLDFYLSVIHLISLSQPHVFYSQSSQSINGSFLCDFVCLAGHGSRAVYGMHCLRSLGRWDRGFKTNTRHGCLTCVCVFLCLCDELITRPRSLTVCEWSRNWEISPMLQIRSKLPNGEQRGRKNKVCIIPCITTSVVQAAPGTSTKS